MSPIHEKTYYRNLFSCFKHPLWSLMFRTLKVRQLDWVSDKVPDEVYQEADIFLSDPEWVNKNDAQGEDRDHFCRSWANKIYYLAKTLGFSPGVRFRREITSSSFSTTGEGGYNVELEDIVFSTHEFAKTAEHNRQNKWTEDYLKICQQAIFDTGNGQAEIEWEAFKGYLFGKNLIELQELTGWSPANSIPDRLTNCIDRIRQKVGVPLDIPLPPLPLFNAGADFKRKNLTKTSPRQRIVVDSSLSIEKIMEKWGVVRSTAVKAQKRGWLCLPPKRVAKSKSKSQRRVTIDTFLSMVEIMEKYGVSRASAWRAKKNGWLCPKYHEKNPEIIRTMSETGCSSETARKMAKKKEIS